MGHTLSRHSGRRAAARVNWGRHMRRSDMAGSNWCNNRGMDGRSCSRGDRNGMLSGGNRTSGDQGEQSENPYFAHEALPGGWDSPLYKLRRGQALGGFINAACLRNSDAERSGREALYFRPCQYFQVMSAPDGAVAVICRAICGKIRW